MMRASTPEIDPAPRLVTTANSSDGLTPQPASELDAPASSSGAGATTAPVATDVASTTIEPSAPGPTPSPLKDPFGEVVENMGGRLGDALGPTFAHTPWTGWLALLAGILFGVVLARVTSSLLDRAGERLRQRRELPGLALGAIARPIGLAILALGLAFGLGMLHLSDAVAGIAAGTIALLYVVAVGWAAVNLVELIETVAQRAIARTDPRAAMMVAPLIGKALRVFVLVVFALFAAENVFKADITAWLAGLGIAGLAISLASQDSVRNLFGSITVLLDKPFAVGDRIVFDGADGTVERIGLRSTRIRLLTGHLLTMPNMRFIDGKVENVSARPSVRRLMNVTITYDTPPARIDEALAIIRGMLTEPELAAELVPDRAPVVRFNEFNSESLNILVVYWYLLRGTEQTWDTYQAHAERFNLALVRRFGAAGIEFAFPTRTLLLAGDPARRLRIEHVAAAPEPAG